MCFNNNRYCNELSLGAICMMDFLINLLNDFFFGISSLLLQIFFIIIGLLVTIELLRVLGVISSLNKILYQITKYIGITKNASLPLFIGLIAGITYGAGSIIASYKSNEMTKKDVLLVSVFMCLCHALIEDTIIFATLGANGFIIVVVRFFIALIFTISVNLIVIKKEKI